jgi:hypothetical protein
MISLFDGPGQRRQRPRAHEVQPHRLSQPSIMSSATWAPTGSR